MTDEKPRGRPPIPFPENASAEVIRLGQEGSSITEMAAHFGVAKSTFYEWIDRHPDFSDSVKRAVDLAQAWWERQGKAGIWSANKFSPATYCFIMKNRFKDDYRDNPHADKEKAETVVNVNISKDDAGL